MSEPLNTHGNSDTTCHSIAFGTFFVNGIETEFFDMVRTYEKMFAVRLLSAKMP